MEDRETKLQERYYTRGKGNTKLSKEINKIKERKNKSEFWDEE